MLSMLLDTHLYAPSLSTWPSLGVGLLIAILGTAVLVRERFSGVSMAFFLLTGATAIWLFCIAAVYSTQDPALLRLWTSMEHLGVVFIPTMVYAFSLAIIQRVRQHKTSLLASFLASGLFYWGLLTTPWFIKGMHHYSWGYYPHYGPLSLPFLAFFGVLLSASLRLLWKAYRRFSPVRHRERLNLFLIAL